MAWLVEEGTTEVYRKEIEKTQLGFIWEIWQELDIRDSRPPPRTAVAECLLIIILTVATCCVAGPLITTDYQYYTPNLHASHSIVVIFNIDARGEVSS